MTTPSYIVYWLIFRYLSVCDSLRFGYLVIREAAKARSPVEGTFFAFFAAQALSLFGSTLASFALIWWLTQTTALATVLAMAALASLLPGIVFGPLAGALVDRWDRRWVLIVSDGAIGLAGPGWHLTISGRAGLDRFDGAR